MRPYVVLGASPPRPVYSYHAARSGHHSHAASRYAASRYPCHALQPAAVGGAGLCSSVTHGIGTVTDISDEPYDLYIYKLL